jgi:acetyl-CoA acetyltransferase
MGITAENLAVKYGIKRADADAFSLQSQQRWAKAQAAGIFNAEIAPVEIKVGVASIIQHRKALLLPSHWPSRFPFSPLRARRA